MRSAVRCVVVLGLTLAAGCGEQLQCPTGLVRSEDKCITPDPDLEIELSAGARSLLAFDPAVEQYNLATGFLASEVKLRVSPLSEFENFSLRGLERELDARGEAVLSLQVGSNELRLTSVEGATYVIGIRREPVAELQQRERLESVRRDELQFFGEVLAIDGDTVVVAAPFGEGGPVPVFRLQEPGWAREAALESFEREEAEPLGRSLGLDGDTIAVGSRWGGAVHLFERSGTTWSRAQILSTETGDEAFFGFALDMNGDTMVVGAPFDSTDADFSGAAYIFVRDESGWSEQAFLKATNVGAEDFFGGSVSLDGDTVAIGASWEDGSSVEVNGAYDDLSEGSGAVYVFVRQGTEWSQQAYLKPFNTGDLDRFGISVAVEKDTIVVGAPHEDGSSDRVNGADDDLSEDSGAAYVFVREGAEWSQQAYIKATNAEPGDEFGSDIAISGDTLVVGAPREAGGDPGIDGDVDDNTYPGSGAVYVFGTQGSTWRQTAYIKSSDPRANDEFGAAIALDGDTLVVGASGEDGATGAAYVFK